MTDGEGLTGATEEDLLVGDETPQPDAVHVDPLDLGASCAFQTTGGGVGNRRRAGLAARGRDELGGAARGARRGVGLVGVVQLDKGGTGGQGSSGNALTADSIWSFTTVTADMTPPTVTSTTPTDGALDVGIGTAVTASFSEAMDGASIDSTNFELRDDTNALVSAAVTYDVATERHANARQLADQFRDLYRHRQGWGRRSQRPDRQPLAVDEIWSFTTAAPGTCPCTIWDETTTPALLADPDTSAVEVGVKFRTNVDGLITGIRFYKSGTNTGTHVGNLWSSDGQLLASATFTNEAASGWQQVDFASPVAITANTIYVASYHTDVGQYSVDENYFAASGVNNGPFHALQDGESGGNGVYLYGGGGFPTNTFRSSNYWVDVVFTE